MKQNKRSRVTLDQVAKHAGVSRATASLVARNSNLIAKKTQEKVRKSMSELGYVYDRLAANLRSQSSSTVGLIITEIANPYFSEMLAGVHESLDHAGYTVILGTTHESHQKQDILLSTMMENRVGGVIISPVSEEMAVENIKRLKEWGVPIVLVARKANGMNYDYVAVDNIYGAKKAIEHLIEQGHKRIAYLGGTNESSWKERKDGYIQALRQAGIEMDKSLILNTPVTREGGKEGIKKMLQQPNPPTAVFCYNDVVALGVMLGLRECGLVPGKDIALVGFDNIKEASLSTPPLTTVTGYPQRLGTIAADRLHQRIEGLDSKSEEILLKPELIIRESSSFKS